VHITDIHYKGNTRYLRHVVNRINVLKPDYVCFTGDIVENTKFLDVALSILSGINAPVYGCPGNHDYWSHAPFDRIADTFRATGGDWLVDGSTVLTNKGITFTGYTDWRKHTNSVPSAASNAGSTITICLTHYPNQIHQKPTNAFDLILAGHSHGGQIRLPFLGAPVLPFGVGEYDTGLFETPAGPLYVNPGIGTFFLPARLFCRPEITVIEL